jgi:hypothetical protein
MVFRFFFSNQPFKLAALRFVSRLGQQSALPYAP